MELTTLLAVAQAGLWGALHAVNPCVHSWPTLLPFVGPGRHPIRTGLLFGLGTVIAGVAWGWLAGSLGSLPSDDTSILIEEVSGVVLVIFGILFIARPLSLHWGHRHKDHAHEPGTACEHPEVGRRLVDRVGPNLALFILGAGHVAIPHPTTLPALSMATGMGSPWAGIAVMGTFGLATGLVMILVLALLQRGLRVLDRLVAGQALPLLMRCSGLILVVFGLSMVFHWWHEH